ncbi:MAG: PilZ domain-containing protein [Candidatus Sulfobium sp.]
MDYYIVRIYDRMPDEGRLVGTVEDVEGKQGRAFQSPEHLLCFLWGCEPQERRLSGRLPLVLPVRVEGRNTAGKKFTEESFLKNISYGSAFFESRNEADRDALVSLLIDPERSAYKAQARVARQEPLTGAGGYGIGVRF